MHFYLFLTCSTFFFISTDKCLETLMMADPLTLLREFNRDGKSIEEKDGKYFIFGEYCWPKSAKTNFRIQGSQDDKAGTWKYYTVETVVHFLKNTDLFHPDYVKKAAEENIPAVRRPDRKKLLTYLRGTDSLIPKSIDTSTELQKPMHIHDLKRTSENSLEVQSLPKRARGQAHETPTQEMKGDLSNKFIPHEDREHEPIK